MKSNSVFILLFFIIAPFLSCQNNVQEESASISFHINHNVKNSEESYFKEIQTNWEAYLNAYQYVRTDNEFWNRELYPYPDYSYIALLLDLQSREKNGKEIQCSTIGIVPVENDFYLLKTVFTDKASEDGHFVDIKFIISVYAKKEGGIFKFHSSTSYHKSIFETKQVGDISYIVHPDHDFSIADAQKMNAFNSSMSKLFEAETLAFDYALANDTRDLSEIMGVDLFSYSFQPVASGGMADNLNTIIYAGNNSAYYPHEVVHLYTYAKFQRQYHRWYDEGIAALLGGSTGYKIEWHWEKLRRFLQENPDYPISDLAKLETDIPNGEFMTDFRYAIGALICQRIIDKKGMNGVFEALQAGRSDENYFDFLKEHLDVARVDFGKYVKEEVAKLTAIEDVDLENYKY